MRELNRPQASGRAGRWRGVALALALLPFAAMAELPDHPNRQEPPRPDFLPAKPGRVFELPAVAPLPPSAPATTAGVQINRILFRGNAAIDAAELEAVAAPYVGRRLDEAGLEEVRQRITRHYVERGFVNSGALLGKDAIRGDSVTFDLVEGRLGAIRVSGLERLNDDYVVDRLRKGEDTALNVDDLRERFQLLLDDPLFERMNARLMPGARLGEAVLDVEVQRALPYQVTLAANNYRPPSIGADGYALSGWVRNLTGYGDLFEASLQNSNRLTGADGRYGLGWRMPLNASGTLLSLQLDHGRSAVLEEPMTALDIESTLDSKDLGISQVMIESLRHKFTLGLNRVERENDTKLLGQPFSFTPGEPNGVTKVSAWRFWQEYAHRTEQQVFALRSTFTWARNNLEDIAGLPAVAAQPDRRYSLWLGQLQYARQVLENGAQVVARVSVQQSAHALVALDRMSIGGVATVRGYRENQFIRDTGDVENLELDYPLVRGGGKDLNLSLIPFYDRGRGRNRNEAAATLSSCGLAARMRWQGFMVDLAAAARLAHPDSVTRNGGTLQDRGIHVQMAYSFF